MEWAATPSAALGASSNFAVFPPSSSSRTQLSYPIPVRNSLPKSLYYASKSKGSYLPLGTIRFKKLFYAATIGDTATVSYDFAKEHFPNSEQSDSVASCEATENTYEEKDEKGSAEGLDDQKMIRICDKLIEVFMVDKPTPTDWRKLLAFSRKWGIYRPHFYKRCQERADNENDPGMKHKLLKFARKLKEIDEDVQRHDELLQVIRKSQSNISEIVAKRRKDFTKEFFVHVYTVAESYYDDPTEQNAVAKLGNMCMAAVQTYDTATESIEAINAAELKLQDIINSPSVEAACRKIDSLAERNELDSTLVLMITKAWSAAKESSMAKDEAKDILYHLYLTARGNQQRLMPKEARILKYLLTIEDPEERLSALRDAFTPGEEIEGKDVDCLYTTPKHLYTLIRTVVDAYQFSREGTLMREARDLMNPKIIPKLEELMKLVQDHFL